jgi:hypothetical protein
MMLSLRNDCVGWWTAVLLIHYLCESSLVLGMDKEKEFTHSPQPSIILDEVLESVVDRSR